MSDSNNYIKTLKNKEKVSAALTLLHAIIEKANENDNKFKADRIKNHKALEASGESWELHNLKMLREILLILQQDL